MCSVEEDIEDLSTYSRTQQNKAIKRNLSKCKKCDESSILLLQKKDPFCRKCFFEYCDHKFRSTIGKTKKIKHGDKVLVACSGGRKAAALLHMTNQALESASVKQISFTPGIVFIDETIVAPSVVEDGKYQVEEIIKELKEFGYPVLLSSLEMAYRLDEKHIFHDSSETCDLNQNFGISSEAQIQLKNCIADMTLSAKIDFIKHLRLLLITEIASRAGYNYVFVGDSASSLAGNLLSNIALGRGSQISSDTNFYDTRYKVPICRPIREFLNKELALYNHLHNCSFRVLADLLTKTDDKSSVQRLTESFITNLQDDFPATVFTIFRTGGKLSKFGSSVYNEICILCKSKLDNLYPEACSALEALKISEKLSQLAFNSSDIGNGTNSLDCAADVQDTYSVGSKELDATNLFKFLCHGCSIPFRHKKEIDFFPLHPEIQYVQMERHQMKDSLKEFLIKDDEPS